MADAYEIAATVRDRVGKGAARALRRERKIPAVIYGDKKPPVPIAIDFKEMSQQLHSGGFLTTVATVNVDGEKTKVIPRDYQLDPVRDFLVHIDFLRITKGAVLTLEIPVSFLNEEECEGLKRGGVLNIVRHVIEMECPADNIPERIEVDLTGLDIGDSIHISAIEVPEGSQPTITDRDFTIATIASPALLVEPTDEEEDVEGLEGEALAEDAEADADAETPTTEE